MPNTQFLSDNVSYVLFYPAGRDRQKCMVNHLIIGILEKNKIRNSFQYRFTVLTWLHQYDDYLKIIKKSVVSACVRDDLWSSKHKTNHIKLGLTFLYTIHDTGGWASNVRFSRWRKFMIPQIRFRMGSDGVRDMQYQPILHTIISHISIFHFAKKRVKTVFLWHENHISSRG